MRATGASPPALLPLRVPGRAGRRPGAARPPGSGLPGSPCRGRSSRASTRRGRAWASAGLLTGSRPGPHGHAESPTCSAGAPGVSLQEPPDQKSWRPQGGAGTRLPGRWGTCYRARLSPEVSVRQRRGIAFSEQRGRWPFSPHCCCGLGLGALVGVRTARGACGGWRANPCLGLGYLLPQSALGLLGLRVDDGTSLGAGGKARPPLLPPGLRRGEAGGQGLRAGHPPHSLVTLRKGSWGSSLRLIWLSTRSLAVAWTRRWGPASPSTGRAALEAILPLWPLLVRAACQYRPPRAF